MLKPSKVSQEGCPGLELFTIKEAGNPLDGEGDQNLLKTLIERRLDEQRRRVKNTTLDGMTFTPLVEERREVKEGVEAAAKALADEIWASSAQNPMLASHVFKQYWTKITRMKFMCRDLMAPLLVTQEELLFPDMPEGADTLEVEIPVFPQVEQPEAQIQAPSIPPQFAGPAEFGGQQGMQPSVPVHYSLQETPPQKGPPFLPEVVEVRLASIREMIKHYFKEYPEDYAKALSAALGIAAGDGGDDEFLEQRVAFEVARVGSWALSLRVLEEIKKRQSKKGGGPDPWRMGLKVGKKGKKPWAYVAANEKPVFCPRWMGLNWNIAVGMLAALIAR